MFNYSNNEQNERIQFIVNDLSRVSHNNKERFIKNKQNVEQQNCINAIQQAIDENTKAIREISKYVYEPEPEQTLSDITNTLQQIQQQQRINYAY